MLKPKKRTIKIQTGVNPSFLENTLTEDISPLASIFDLIDNSIDAARDHLLKSKPVKDEYGLPASYLGYKIQIRLDHDSFRILDNCLGIEENTLSKKTFYVANTSNHSFGIGYYGLGLKRSLLKFGSAYALATDSGDAIFKMSFNNKDFGSNDGESLTADEYSSNGRRKVLFSVSNLKSEVKYEIHSDRWFDNAIKELSIRYAIYVSKGLQITFRSISHHKCIKIDATLPTLRTNGKFPPQKSEPTTIDGVSVYIESGIHNDYLFPSETGHSIAKNRLLTKYFGLYFICNDRVIVAHSLASEHGWKTTWHSEYNGFVCLVRFVSENSGKMPWNTAKTAIRTDSTLFLKVREDLQPIADFYRQDIKRRYTKKPKPTETPPITTTSTAPGTQLPLLPTATSTLSPGPAVGGKPIVPLSPAISNQHLHVTNWANLLPPHFPTSDENIINALVIEAIRLEMAKTPYAAAMLYRAMLEAALKRFAYKTKNFQAVKNHYYSSSEGLKKNHTEEYKAAQGLTTPMIISWLIDNTALFDDENRSKLTLSIKKLKDHISFLNGVVHGNQLTNAGRVTEIRNDTIELLQFLITKNL